jgi:hypothetical protein
VRGSTRRRGAAAESEGPGSLTAGRLPDVLEVAYTALLAAVSVLIAWFSFYVLYKLFKGQS